MPSYLTNDSAGTLANLPKGGLIDGRIYRPIDGLLTLRASGGVWQPLGNNGLPLTDPLTSLIGPRYKWTLTGSGTSEYACELAAGGNPSLSQPGSVFLAGDEATSGTAGSLAANRWAWGSYSGFNTVIVRLTGNADPNAQTYGYVRAADYSWQVASGATISVVKGLPYLTSTSNGATVTQRAWTKNTPATPYTLMVGFLPADNEGTNLYHLGPVWSDGTKFTCFGIRPYNKGIFVSNLDNATTFNSDSVGLAFSAARYLERAMIYMAIRDDGTNRYCYIGPVPDINYMTLVYSVARTTFLTPTKVGIGYLNTSGVGGAWFPHLSIGA